MPKISTPAEGEFHHLFRLYDVPDDHVVVTYSEMDTFRQCPLKHHWAYRERWAKTPKVGSALAKGTLWHNVLETHYEMIRRGETDPDKLRAFALREYLIDPDNGQQDADQVLIEWMYDGYVEHYGTDPEWEILATEVAGQVPLPHESGRYHLRFKIDMLVRQRSTGKVWLVDHKSARDFTRQAEIDIDDQFGLYTWALRKLGIPVFGFIRSDTRTQRNKGPMTAEQRFRRVLTYRTGTELRNIAADAADTADHAWGGEPVRHSSPAPDRCTWRCDFLEAHLMVRKGADEERVLPDFGFHQNEKKHREYEPNPALSALDGSS